MIKSVICLQCVLLRLKFDDDCVMAVTSQTFTKDQKHPEKKLL